jgi:hypothetical protein
MRLRDYEHAGTGGGITRARDLTRVALSECRARPPNSPFGCELTHLRAISDLIGPEFRRISMRLSPTNGRAEYNRLYVAYKEAWRRFSSNVSYLQALESAAPEHGVALERARDAVREAEASYHKSRNRLAEYMLANSLPTEQFVNC